MVLRPEETIYDAPPMKSIVSKTSKPSLYALIAGFIICGISNAVAVGNEDSASEQIIQSSAQATPAVLLPPGEINGEGTIVGPNGGRPEFDIIDIENEQVTRKFLEGEFAYSDRKSHVVFATGKINAVTISGNTASFSGVARIGGKHKQKVTFTVNVTANQNRAIDDTFSITLSNGYSASGNLTRGFISIDLRE
jgi:hypothetical protein